MAENKKVKKTSSRSRSKKKKSKALKIILSSLLIIMFILTVTAAGLSFAIIKTAPDLDINSILSASETSTIYDDNDTTMDTIITDKKKVIIKHEDMPKNLINAFVSIEDERFFKHKGIDFKRILGAIFVDMKNIIHGSPKLQGASTITQQLLKLTLYETPGKTLNQKVKRKIQEWYLAPKLEKKASKEDILEAYLNTIYLGGRAIGVEAAARQYFGISAKQLSLTQCAFIAGLPQSPSVYYPYSRTSRKDPSKYINRTKTVLAKMKENGYINDNEYKDAIKELDTSKSEITSNNDVQTLGRYTIGKPSSNDDKYNYEWFSRAVVNEVKKDLKQEYNYSNDEIENLLVNGGLIIHSTMNRTLQETTQKILNEDSKLKSLSSTDKSGTIYPQASAVLVDYHTGEVKTIVGGRGDQPAMSYNRATDARVPAGSSIKPLTVYSPAIDTKMATAATVLEDSPLPTAMVNKYSSGGKVWQPKNANGRYSGYLNLRNALKNSVNVFSVKLEDMIGLNTGAKYGEKFGLTLDNVDKSSIAALSLGELNHGTNTFTMANAYGVFGNNGLYTKPRLYTTVTDRTGKIILESKVETKKVLSPESAYIMYDLLKEPVKGGTAYKANYSYKSSIPLAGKTGSSTNFKNLWFCGLTPYYSGAIWIENKYKQGIYSSDAAYLMGKIMNESVGNLPFKDIEPPSNIVKADVDRVSGLLPSSLSYRDPRGSQVYTELFIKGTVPTEVDNIHVEARINKLTGKLAGPYTPSFLVETKVFLKRDYFPSVSLDDQMYVIPKEYDNSSTVPEGNENLDNNSQNENDKENPPEQNDIEDNHDTKPANQDNTGNIEDNNTSNTNDNNTGTLPKDQKHVNKKNKFLR